MFFPLPPSPQNNTNYYFSIFFFYFGVYPQGEHWAQKARESSDNRGKLLRRDGFSLAEDHYGTYKPILEEVERILAEAGLDEDEMKRASAVGQAGASGESRNRR